MMSGDWQWLRVQWLWGFVPWLLMLILWVRQRQQATLWEQYVDPQLRPYVIDSVSEQRSLAPYVLFLAWAVMLIVLAGPVWKQQEVPVFQAQQAEVIVLDLSRSMLIDDVLPDRLTRAKFKLLDLLRASEGRQIGLIAFSERPYVISPLTEDSETIEAFVPSLSPGVMPVQGSRLDLALERATQLLAQAGVERGHILYIGDEVPDARDQAMAQRVAQSGHRLSVLGVGTAAGKPLRDVNDRFLQTADGAVVVPRLDMPRLEDLATHGGGVGVMLSADDTDLQVLARVRTSLVIEGEDPEQAAQQLYWIEFAPYLLWPLVIMALLLFRRGVTS